MGFSPDGNLSASGDENGDVIIWDLRQAARLEAVKGHTAPVWSLAFSQPDGAILASGQPLPSASAALQVSNRSCAGKLPPIRLEWMAASSMLLESLQPPKGLDAASAPEWP